MSHSYLIIHSPKYATFDEKIGFKTRFRRKYNKHFTDNAYSMKNQ